MQSYQNKLGIFRKMISDREKTIVDLKQKKKDMIKEITEKIADAEQDLFHVQTKRWKFENNIKENENT